MKFVCDRCLTKYSIADEKVRGRILKIRCKSCSNIITVKESAPVPISVTEGDSDRTVINSGPMVVGPAGPPPRPAPPTGRGKEPGRPLRPPTPPAPLPASDDVQWFLALEGVQKGPFARKVLIEKLLALPKNSDVHVWNDTLDGWKTPADVPVVARDLHARQRHAPAPPPPPAARLRPVPPPPGHSGAHSPAGGRHLPAPHAVPAGPAHGSGLHARGHGHGGAAHQVPAVAHAPGHSHAHTPGHHSGPSHSSVGLGLASAQAAAAAVDPGVMLDTPVPIRELVQAHKANGEARLSGAYSTAAVAAPHAANGESDALQALNLGQSWRQPGAPASASEGSLTAAAMAAAGVARGRQKTIKLATGFVAVAAIFVAVVFIALKRPPTSAAANPKVTVGSESALAGKGPDPKEVKVLPPASEPTEGTGEGDATPGGGKAETVARISSGKKPLRPAGGRNPPGRVIAGSTTTVPSAFSPEQRSEASRFADTSRNPLQVRPLAPTVSKVTPNQSDIARVVNANKGGIKICYQRALLRDNTLTHGKIDVEVTIGISGRVKNVAIQGPASFRALDPCIKDVLSRWVFPASSEEYGTGFSYVFQGNE